MRFALPVAAVVLLSAFVMFAVLSADDGSAASAVEVDGKVVDYDGTALGGVTVSLTDGDTVYSKETDSNGEFQFTGLSTDTGLIIYFDSSGRTVTAPAKCMTAYQDGFKLDATACKSGVFDLGSITMLKTYLSGYIMESASGGNVPLSGHTVTVSDKYTATIGTDGLFKIPIDTVYGIIMAVDAPGYTPVPGDLFFIKVSTSGDMPSMTFNLSGTDATIGAIYSVQYTDADGVRTYTLPSVHPILMSASTGSLTTYVVDGKGNMLDGAQMTLTDEESSKMYTGVSDPTGRITINDMTTGTYHVIVKLNGFDTCDDGYVTISKGSNTPPQIVMKEKSTGTYLGLDLSHFEMALGVVAGVIIVLIMAALYRRNPNRSENDDAEE